jgi:hypothetical protein
MKQLKSLGAVLLLLLNLRQLGHGAVLVAARGSKVCDLTQQRKVRFVCGERQHDEIGIVAVNAVPLEDRVPIMRAPSGAHIHK